LNNGQSGSSGVNQGRVIPSKAPTSQSSRKATMQQIYVPKKVKTPVILPPRARPQSVITIGSIKAPITNHDGPIVIEETPAQKQGKAPKEVARDEKKEHVEGDSMYCQPVWCPRRLNKT
jgi:hypothetical protein